MISRSTGAIYLTMTLYISSLLNVSPFFVASLITYSGFANHPISIHVRNATTGRSRLLLIKSQRLQRMLLRIRKKSEKW